MREPNPLADAAAAFERGDYRQARAALDQAPPPTDPEGQRLHAQLSRGLRLDAAVVLTGVVLLALWVVLYVSSV